MRRLIKSLIERIVNRAEALSYSREVEELRSYPRLGSKVLILMGESVPPRRGTIVNVRRYSSGATEVFIHGDDNFFSKWIEVSDIIPDTREAKEVSTFERNFARFQDPRTTRKVNS